MKNIKYFYGAILVLGVLAGCGSQWEQDPLADKDAMFKRGQVRPTKPEVPAAIDSNNVVIDTVDQYTFREGTPGEFTITARILESDYLPELAVENLSDFPGASFSVENYDQATRLLTAKFSWTPPEGVVRETIGLEDEKEIKLVALGKKTNAAVVVRHRALKVKVGKVLHVPEIFSITKVSSEIREGESTTFAVQVRDNDAGIDSKLYPDLLVLPLSGFVNPSPFITVTRVVPKGNHEFLIDLKLDLADAELTKSRSRLGFALKAVSRFNQVSPVREVYLSALTSFTPLQTTWFHVLEVPAQGKKEFQFMIFDPKTELSVARPDFADLPAGASIDCKAVAAIQLCNFSWTPEPAIQEGDYAIQAQVAARNQDFQDAFVETTRFKFEFRVIAASSARPLRSPGGQ